MIREVYRRRSIYTLRRVENAVRILNTYKLTSREFHPGNTVVDVDGVKIGDGSFVTMAGPCSIEGLDQIRECARGWLKPGAQNSEVVPSNHVLLHMLSKV